MNISVRAVLKRVQNCTMISYIRRISNLHQNGFPRNSMEALYQCVHGESKEFMHLEGNGCGHTRRFIPLFPFETTGL